MPNIELYGLPSGQAAMRAEQILCALRSTGMNLDDVVVTNISSGVIDTEGRARPFLRIVAPKDTPLSEWGKIKSALAGLRLDIEVLLLDTFIPAQK